MTEAECKAGIVKAIVLFLMYSIAGGKRKMSGEMSEGRALR